MTINLMTPQGRRYLRELHSYRLCDLRCGFGRVRYGDKILGHVERRRSGGWYTHRYDLAGDAPLGPFPTRHRAMWEIVWRDLERRGVRA